MPNLRTELLADHIQKRKRRPYLRTSFFSSYNENSPYNLLISPIKMHGVLYIQDNNQLIAKKVTMIRLN